MPFEGPIPVDVVDVDADFVRRWRASVVARTKEMEQRLLTLGWCQRRLVDHTGARCFVGSLHPDVISDQSYVDGVAQAILLSAKRSVRMDIVSWNDTPGRTKEQVLGLIGRVRSEFEG